MNKVKIRIIISIIIILLSFIIPVRKEDETIDSGSINGITFIPIKPIEEKTYYNIYNMKIIKIKK